MREEYGKCKIAIYGNAKEISEARGVLDGLALSCDESKDRLLIQDVIDQRGVKADILYDGNTVWSHDRVIRDFKRALKSGPSPVTETGGGDYDLTEYLYKFLSLECGSIAHYDKYGWIGTYPTKAELCGFTRKNEFGEDILSHQPDWATDRQRIAKDMLKLCETDLNWVEEGRKKVEAARARLEEAKARLQSAQEEMERFKRV